MLHLQKLLVNGYFIIISKTWKRESVRERIQRRDRCTVGAEFTEF